MNESLVVRVGESFERAEDDRLGLRQRQTTVVLEHQVPDTPAVAELHDEVEDCARSAALQDADDVRVLELRGDRDLTFELVDGLVVRIHAGKHDFDRDNAAVGTAGAIHRAESSTARLPLRFCSRELPFSFLATFL